MLLANGKMLTRRVISISQKWNSMHAIPIACMRVRAHTHAENLGACAVYCAAAAQCGAVLHVMQYCMPCCMMTACSSDHAVTCYMYGCTDGSCYYYC